MTTPTRKIQPEALAIAAEALRRPWRIGAEISGMAADRRRVSIPSDAASVRAWIEGGCRGLRVLLIDQGELLACVDEQEFRGAQPAWALAAQIAKGAPSSGVLALALPDDQREALVAMIAGGR